MRTVGMPEGKLRVVDCVEWAWAWMPWEEEET
jgi:hypothetical protein